MSKWYALVDHEVVGPFEGRDPWYHDHAGPDWRYTQWRTTGQDPWCVAHTAFEDGTWVSTVFLGLDQNHGFWDNAPLVFETMVLPSASESWRYNTWDVALTHHNLVVEHMSLTKGTPLHVQQPEEVTRDQET